MESKSMTYLTLPSHISRATSRESFASDASIISLSSFASEIGQINRQVSDLALDDEPSDIECGQRAELLKCREDMLERMLESSALVLPQMRSRQSSHNSSRRNHHKEHSYQCDLTESDCELIEDCMQVRMPRLFKSFSMSDLAGIIQSESMKHCASQAWIPSGYVLMLQCRRKHLIDFRRNMNSSPPVTTPEGNKAKDPVADMLSMCSSEHKASSLDSMCTARRRASTGGPLLRRLKFSKQIGRKIRDDLLRKIGKQKEKVITRGELQRNEGRPVTKNERNFMIFHWLQSLDDDSLDQP